MILFVAVMVFLMRKVRPQQQRQADFNSAQIDELRRQNELLERIAKALEKRPML